MFVGRLDGACVGSCVGKGVGNMVGSGVGNAVGFIVGFSVGCLVGCAVGVFVGRFVGFKVGADVLGLNGDGDCVLTLGSCVGAPVGALEDAIDSVDGDNEGVKVGSTKAVGYGVGESPAGERVALVVFVASSSTSRACV